MSSRTQPVSDLFFGPSEANKRLLRDLRGFSPTPYSILLLGATGTGKTVIARHIRDLSPRQAQPFVDCSLPGIAEELRHAELSGYRKGAFTGAVEDRVGLLESAHRGTLFLDELGYASLNLQQLLLTALESGSVRRLGEVRDRPIDVRFIFATTCDLSQMREEGAFLEELYYRVECPTIRVPALAARREDIVPLASRFLREALEQLAKPYRAVLCPDLSETLTSAPWPGNVRQLKSACRYIAVRLDSDRIADPGDLPDSFLKETSGKAALTRRDWAKATLDRTGGNKAKAARDLGMSRQALYRLLENPPNIQPPCAQRI